MSDPEEEDPHIEEDDFHPDMGPGLVGTMLPGGWGKEYRCSECDADLDGDEKKCPNCGCTFE